MVNYTVFALSPLGGVLCCRILQNIKRRLSVLCRRVLAGRPAGTPRAARGRPGPETLLPVRAARGPKKKHRPPGRPRADFFATGDRRPCHKVADRRPCPKLATGAAVGPVAISGPLFHSCIHTCNIFHISKANDCAYWITAGSGAVNEPQPPHASSPSCCPRHPCLPFPQRLKEHSAPQSRQGTSTLQRTDTLPVPPALITGVPLFLPLRVLFFTGTGRESQPRHGLGGLHTPHVCGLQTGAGSEQTRICVCKLRLQRT